MDPDTLRQVRGGVELASSAVEGALGATARTHETIMRQVYAPFALLGPLAAPAQAVEQIQTAITGQVYQAILGANRLVTRAALALLEHQAAAQPPRDISAPPR